LNVIRLALPALRERKQDIPLLAAYFTERCAARARRRVDGISPEALSLLAAYDWPGNVRELENAIERAVVLGQSDSILPEDLPEEFHERPPASQEMGRAGYHGSVRDAKRRTVLEALEMSGYSYTEAARRLGIHPNNLHRLVNNLGLRNEIRRLTQDSALPASG
jgi:DNA-binding NtrC family response regulator